MLRPRRNYRNTLTIDGIYIPEPERVSAWVWAADVIGGALLILTILACTFLVAVLSFNTKDSRQLVHHVLTLNHHNGE